MLFGELLKGGAGGASAAGASGDAGKEGAEAERLEQFASGVDLFAAIAADARRERDANRVADAFVEQNAHGGGRPDGALQAHAGFGEAEMQGLAGALGERAIDGDQMQGARDFAGDDDLIFAQAALQGELGGFDGGENHALVDDLLGGEAEIRGRYSPASCA